MLPIVVLQVNNLTDESIPRDTRVSMVKKLAEASERAWQGICSRDSTKLGSGLSETMAAWESMLPYTVDPYLGEDPEKSKQLKEFWTRYDIPFTKGCLFSGAGGGFLFVINDSPVEGAVKIQINNSHWCRPFKSDNLHSLPHPVPFT